MENKPKTGRPYKFKHSRPLTGAERVKAFRAKRNLASYSHNSLQFKKAKEELEQIYSEGINPNREEIELKDQEGSRIDIHGFTYKDTKEGRTEENYNKFWRLGMKSRGLKDIITNNSYENYYRYI